MFSGVMIKLHIRY